MLPAPLAASPSDAPRFASSADSHALARLCAELDAALNDPRTFARRVRAALAEASRDSEFLTPEQRAADAHTYRRHLLAADPFGRYALAALVWEPGQASPVHGHQTWCGYAVLEGTLTETLFQWDAADNRAIPTRRHARETGAVSVVGAGRGAIHQLGNAHGSGRRAISLHVYGVEGARIATHVNDLVAV
ncbi:putative metal-dependent enzyme (double-stranded beta helix superfamily) [Paraburkholderia sp. BL8N3]|nr:cysteine dioxygenase family protein [Paraburkholderia sp. BL8N3]TCK43075.1 putative metal-dependent enzyme (double-stranded beta helix superfamily) [Paraburkholderia sp. BL8N3]